MFFSAHLSFGKTFKPSRAPVYSGERTPQKLLFTCRCPGVGGLTFAFVTGLVRAERTTARITIAGAKACQPTYRALLVFLIARLGVSFPRENCWLGGDDSMCWGRRLSSALPQHSGRGITIILELIPSGFYLTVGSLDGYVEWARTCSLGT